MQPFADQEFFTGAEEHRSELDHRDAGLAAAVVQALGAEVRTRDQPIRVRTQNGVVILDGRVATATGREVAGECARRTGGVGDVCNELDITGKARRRRASGTVIVLLVVTWLCLPVVVAARNWAGLAVVLLAATVSTREVLRALLVNRR